MRLVDERGAALLVAIMATALMTALGAALVLTSITETAITANYRDGLETLYAAEAGAGLAIAELLSTDDWTEAATARAEARFDELVPEARGSSIRVGVEITPAEAPGGVTVTSTARSARDARRIVRVTVRRRAGQPSSAAEVVFWEQVP